MKVTGAPAGPDRAPTRPPRRAPRRPLDQYRPCPLPAWRAGAGQPWSDAGAAGHVH